MNCGWKISATGGKDVIQSALLTHEEALETWDPDIVVSGSEVDKDDPDTWILEAWLPRKPSLKDKTMIMDLFDHRIPDLVVEELPEIDWLVLSQQGVEPVLAGRFYVHTPHHEPANDTGITNFEIPASQAFGTGQHETTAGCLAMLCLMRSRSVVARNLADIGTGTGLLAFAAMDLWPVAYATASDIDPVCIDVIEENAKNNNVTIGDGPGKLTIIVADGMEHPLLEARGPYDLIIANILAGPLIELAPDIANATQDGGHLLLAGLLETQEADVRRAYRRAGFRLGAKLIKGDWSILWLKKRRRV